MDQPVYTEREDQHVMPWHIRAADAETNKDCILVATMIGNVMQTVSLHVAEGADG